MSAIDTFDWYNACAWEKLDEKTKDFIMRHRRLLMDLRSEDERKRFVFDYITDVYENKGQASSGSRGG
jgi:hypothetical protein